MTEETRVGSVLVTGANRGLGLEWVRQYAAAGWRVYATCRHPAEAWALLELVEQYPGVSLHRLDVTRDDDAQAIAAELEGVGLDRLVNNAGVYLERLRGDELGSLDYQRWQETLAVNTLGPARVTEALLAALERGRDARVAVISSHMGSIAEIDAPGSYYYRSAKAALNAAMKGLALRLAEHGIGLLILHPGWVKTRMGGPNALIEPQESVAGMRRLLENYRPEDLARFYRYDGTRLPW